MLSKNSLARRGVTRVTFASAAPIQSISIRGCAISRTEEIPLSLFKRSLAECFGTYWLVFGGCGSAIFAAEYPTLGIGFAGVALAFGLTVLTMAYAIGHISGCHLNP